MELLIGSIVAVAFPYPPQGWMICNGQKLNFRQHMVLATVFRGAFGDPDNMCLPDLRGRTILGAPTLSGAGSGMRFASSGGAAVATMVGAATLSGTLGVNNLPEHAHNAMGRAFDAFSSLNVTSDNQGKNYPQSGATLCSTNGVGGAVQAAIYQSDMPPDDTMIALSDASVRTSLTGTGASNMSTSSAGANGGNFNIPIEVPVENIPVMQPYIGLNYIIAASGYYPIQDA